MTTTPEPRARSEKRLSPACTRAPHQLLLGRPRRLQHQDGLRQREDAERLQERVGREQRYERVEEDRRPHEGHEEDGAGLGDPAGPWQQQRRHCQPERHMYEPRGGQGACNAYRGRGWRRWTRPASAERRRAAREEAPIPYRCPRREFRRPHRPHRQPRAAVPECLSPRPWCLVVSDVSRCQSTSSSNASRSRRSCVRFVARGCCVRGCRPVQSRDEA